VTTLIRKAPLLQKPLEAKNENGHVLYKIPPFAPVVWVAFGDLVETSPDSRAHPFPVVIDTGFNDYFGVREEFINSILGNVAGRHRTLKPSNRGDYYERSCNEFLLRSRILYEKKHDKPSVKICPDRDTFIMLEHVSLQVFPSPKGHDSRPGVPLIGTKAISLQENMLFSMCDKCYSLKVRPPFWKFWS
jgi:hypothetical protein